MKSELSCETAKECIEMSKEMFQQCQRLKKSFFSSANKADGQMELET